MLKNSFFSFEEDSFNGSDDAYTEKNGFFENLDSKPFQPQVFGNIPLNEEDINDEDIYFIKENQNKTGLDVGNNYQNLTKLNENEEKTKKEKEKETKFTTKTKKDNKGNVQKKNGKGLGRKRLDEKKKADNEDDSGHGKYSEDNMMRKIKINLLEYTLNSLNNSLINKDTKFYRIDKELMENLKKDFNLNLLNNTIYDMFYYSKTSKKYRTSIDEYINHKVIDKIILENKEKETIKILNKKFIDIINEIRNNQYYYREFFDIIQRKEEKNCNREIAVYIGQLKDLLSRYESWFLKKKGRKRGKNVKK